MKKMEFYVGFVLIAVTVVLGKIFLQDMIFFRLLIGVGFGYALARALMGFAGGVNRAAQFGSTLLMRALMLMFFVTATMMAGLLITGKAENYGLWVNPINAGLIVGGLLFGFGMAFSSCCASGVLTDLADSLPRALITLIFFGLGVFLGFPLQKTASWIKNSWFESSAGRNGVFFPDWFGNNPVYSYLGAIIVTAIFCVIVVFLSYWYEKKRKLTNTYHNVPSELAQNTPDTFDSKNFKILSEASYNHFFVKPWTLKQGVVVISALFIILTAVSKSGWGASTPYGHWFGQILAVLGVSPESLEKFTHVPAKVFTIKFFTHPVYVQNLGITLGALFSLLLAGTFMKNFNKHIKISLKDALLFALGGFLMGFGTRLSNGCNVGALYTPIANFSLAGWIYLLMLVIGGTAGNMFAKKVYKNN